MTIVIFLVWVFIFLVLDSKKPGELPSGPGTEEEQKGRGGKTERG